MSGVAGSVNRRLILDLYHSAADANIMRAAVEFAKLLGLDLHCLFIEDEAVFTLAGLPFAREIRLPAHQWGPLNQDIIARELRETADHTRRLLNEVLRGVEIVSRFEVLRGDPATCITAVCQSGDIVIVAEPGAAVVRTMRTLRRLHAAAHASPASVLLLPPRHKARPGHVVAVLATPTDPALDVACRIAVAANENLTILLPQPADEAVVERAKERARSLGLHPARVTCRTVPSCRGDDVVLALAGLQERAIVMSCSAAAADNASSASRIAAARGVPVLLIEGQPSAAQHAGSRQNNPSSATEKVSASSSAKS